MDPTQRSWPKARRRASGSAPIAPAAFPLAWRPRRRRVRQACPIARLREAVTRPAEGDRLAPRDRRAATRCRARSARTGRGGGPAAVRSQPLTLRLRTRGTHDRVRSHQPGDRRARAVVPDDQRRGAARRDRRRRPRPPRVVALDRPSSSGPRSCGGSASCTSSAARSSRRSSCARWASRSSRRSARSTSAARSTSTTPTTRPRCSPTSRSRSRGRRLGVRPPQLDRRGARDHAVELPLLPGRALRRPEPRDRQHDPAQARAAVPRVGRGDRSRSSTTPASRRARTSTSTPPTSRSPTSSPTRACRASR